ncbi:hypothetical protein TREES_T100008801 [Tupaia chinensis]|uniref:Uncharacterized protein n=1 Tax=Tupaia chinensis TaxID=246437 RepID=L9L194_TUPCH|nr:hypothetical protein TREES_T100008801 [Tupaia chinensis]
MLLSEGPQCPCGKDQDPGNGGVVQMTAQVPLHVLNQKPWSPFQGRGDRRDWYSTAPDRTVKVGEALQNRASHLLSRPSCQALSPVYGSR